MNFTSCLPSEILKPYIRKYLIIESGQEMDNKILPGTAIVMAFRLHGRINIQAEDTDKNLPGAVLTGLRKSSRFIHYSKKSATLLVLFKEAGAAAFFKDPLHELFGLHCSLDNLVPRRKSGEIEGRLAEAKNNRERISVVEQFLLGQLQESKPDSLINHSVQVIKSARGNIRVKSLITELPVSRDPFEKRFRKVVGASPGQFANIVRLRNLVDNYSREKSFTETAYSAGYYDQSHFIKDFKTFTGQTPKDFFKSPSFW